MGHRANLIRNTLALSVPNAINPFLSFLLVLIISRYLGVQGLGQYSLLQSFLLIFTTIASLGLSNLVVRQAARRPEDVHLLFVNSLAFGTVSSLIALVAMNMFVYAMKYDTEVLIAAMVCSLCLIPGTATRYIESIFRALERSEFVAAGYVVENSLRVAVCIPVVLLGYGIVAIFIAVLGTRILGFIFMLYCYVRINGVPKWAFRTEIWRLFVKEAPTFAGIVFFSSVHLNMCEIMLSKLQSIEAVGIFSAAGRIVSICETLPMAFSLAVLPLLTRKSSGSLEDLRESSVNSLRYVFLAVLPIAAGTVLLGDEIIQLVYGSKFVSAGPVLRLQAVTMIPFGMVLVLAQLLIATDNQKVDLYINITAVVVSLTLNYILIPYYGEMGAALASLLTVVVLNHLQYLYIRKLLFKIDFFQILKKPLLATFSMCIFTVILKESNPFLNVAVSGFMYFVFLLIFRTLTSEEIIALKRLVGMGGTGLHK